MSTDQHSVAIAEPVATTPGFSRLGIATAAAIVLNLIALAIGTVAGASLQTSAPEPINVVTVILATAVPMLVGGAIALLIIRRKPGFRPWAAWGGLALALVTLPMPFLAATDVGTGATLAAMHVITGLSWFFGLKPREQA